MGFGAYDSEEAYQEDQDFFEFEEDYLKDDEFRDAFEGGPEITEDNETEIFVDLLDEVGDMMQEED